MQYIVVLFLIVGIAVFIIAATLGLSYAFGAALYARAKPGAQADPAARFEADREWYEDLPMWQRNAVIVWWLVNRYLSSQYERGELRAPPARTAAQVPRAGASARRM